MAIATGIHLFPSRTEKLSPFTPMILLYQVGKSVAANFKKPVWITIHTGFFCWRQAIPQAHPCLSIPQAAAPLSLFGNCQTNCLFKPPAAKAAAPYRGHTALYRTGQQKLLFCWRRDSCTVGWKLFEKSDMCIIFAYHLIADKIIQWKTCAP